MTLLQRGAVLYICQDSSRDGRTVFAVKAAKVSKYQLTMVSFGINSIQTKFNTLNHCIGLFENCNIYIYSELGKGEGYVVWFHEQLEILLYMQGVCAYL